MGCGSISSKLCLVLVGFVFLGITAGFSYLGIRIWVDYGHIAEIAKSYYTVIPGATFIGVGILAFLVSIMIFCSACSENKCLLAVVFTILLTIFLGELAAATLGYAYRGKAGKMVNDSMNAAIQKYGNSSYHEITDQFDYLQKELGCCGVHSYEDWRHTPWGKNHSSVPESCYIKDHKDTNATIYTEGCYDKLHDNLKHDLAIIIGVGLGFALLQILGMIAACVLLCRTRQDHIPYEGLGSERPVSGLRV